MSRTSRPNKLLPEFICLIPPPATNPKLAAGPDEMTDKGVTKKSPVKKGDKVIYKKWGGNEVKFDNKEYLFVKFEDVLACLQNN